MTKHILKKMWNERSSNVALLLELFLIALFLWYAIDLVYVQVRNYKQYPGWDVENTYQVKLKEILVFDKEYQDSVSIEDQSAALWSLYDRIKNYDGVESVSMSTGAMPGTKIKSFEMFITRYGIFEQREIASPEVTTSFVDVFKIRSVYGDSESVKSALINKHRVATSDVLNIFNSKSNTVVGDTLFTDTSLNEASEVIYEMIYPIKNNRFTSSIPMLLSNLSEGDMIYSPFYSEICIRVASSAKEGFEERFSADIGKSFVQANMKFDGLQYLPDSFEVYEKEVRNDLLLNSFLLIFLLTNILIGVVGVFTNRAQKSVGEIGLRISFGATPRSAIRMFIYEGVITLLVAFVLAAIVVAILFYIGFPSVSLIPLDTARYVGVLLIVFIVMLVTLTLAVWLPIRKVTKIPPAQSLREE
ncbi:ABC transporter permease [Porphyromonas levii]|uniref:ABC transporter permease n=1 Tax=Porphyromonas levii TaxID=28114 RepID=A0A4Y8WRG8_9PORP|nr:FtsX-like permease family protein [Porphyromonas levii]MBR8712888.1 hypothetical protein [Porphyromonas levii]MBR8714936.1 hypothetical protein [Porphyromonas levii]MBR8727423.1 hypothetical protein [Porphyromonas levii]MBR8731501.1 hypothetical protein [Porphyromonas levii]MBR8735758.1 hypothetical protein [Porphyromonas levii]